MSQGLRQRKGSYDATQVGWNMTVIVTIHNVMLGLRSNGAGDRHLRRILWVRFLEIYRQSSINGLNMGGMVEFEFKRPYKLQVAI